MKHQAAVSTFFLAALFFGSGASATAEINKCVSENGQVTITDERCPEDARAVKLAGQASDSELAETPTVRAVLVERHALPRMPVRASKPMRSLAPARGLSLDVATLKAARANLVLFDSARTQRLAGMP